MGMWRALAYSMEARVSRPAYFQVAEAGSSMRKSSSERVMIADTFSTSPPHQMAVATLCQPSSKIMPPRLRSGSCRHMYAPSVKGMGLLRMSPLSVRMRTSDSSPMAPSSINSRALTIGG